MKTLLIFSVEKFLSFSNFHKSKTLLKQFFCLEEKILNFQKNRNDNFIQKNKNLEDKISLQKEIKDLIENLIQNLSLIKKISFDENFKKLIESLPLLQKIKLTIENNHEKEIISLWQEIQKLFLPLSYEINSSFHKNSFDENDIFSNQQKRDNLDIATKQTKSKSNIHFWLHNLRSCYNVAAIIRLAEGLGIEKIYFSGYTPLPSHEKISKYSMGASLFINWQQYHKEELLNFCKEKNYKTIALETEEFKNENNSVNIFEDFNRFNDKSNQKSKNENSYKNNQVNLDNQPIILLFGNERFGIEKELLDSMDEIFYIPMKGYKNSINVALTAAIAGFYFIAKDILNEQKNS